jgi:hypothetical protein
LRGRVLARRARVSIPFLALPGGGGGVSSSFYPPAPHPGTEMKRCTHCHEPKPLSEFPPNRRTRDRLSSWCRSCHRDATRAWRSRHLEYDREYRRRRKRERLTTG